MVNNTTLIKGHFLDARLVDIQFRVVNLHFHSVSNEPTTQERKTANNGALLQICLPLGVWVGDPSTYSEAAPEIL